MNKISGFVLVTLASIVVLTDTTVAQFPGDGVILSGPVDRVVTHGQHTTFNCYARGDTVYWRINGSIASPPYTTYINRGLNFTVDRQRASDPSRELDTWNLTIRATASLATNNNTRIQCTALGWTLGQSANVLAWLIIAGHPQRPAMQIQSVQNGSAFQITWQKPFAHEQHPITNYMLTVANETSGEERTLTLPPSGETFSRVIRRVTDEVSYNVCNELEFTVKAMNSLGVGAPATLHRAFPIVPEEVDSTLINTEIRFDTSATPHLEINFQVPDICSFQNANYTIEILNNSRRVAVKIGSTPYSPGETSQTVEVMNGLERNHNYTLQIAVQTEYGQTLPATHHFFTKFVSLPHPPQNIDVRHFENGTRIELSWRTDPLQFHYITNYTISMVNQTTGIRQQWIVPAPTDGRERVIFVVPGGGEIVTVCHELHFEVSSTNDLGRSQTGTTVTTGYPIALGAISELTAVPGYRDDGTPYIEISFKIPETCSYQDITYMFVISDENGHSVHTHGPTTVIGGPSRQQSFQFQTTDSLREHSYSIAASLEGVTGLTGSMANTTFSMTQGNHPTTNTGANKDNSNGLVVITGASLGVAVLLCLLVAGGVAFVIVLVCACRCSKRNRSFEPKSKGRKKIPKSLPPMAHNPIYEGPIYDSPGGDSLNSLINSNATTPVNDSPRYFIDNAPPSLPPPRKPSVSIKSPLPQISQHEMDQINFSFDVEVPPCDSEYTIMNPVRKYPVATDGTKKGGEKAKEDGNLEDEYVSISCK